MRTRGNVVTEINYWGTKKSCTRGIESRSFWTESTQQDGEGDQHGQSDAQIYRWLVEVCLQDPRKMVTVIRVC